MFKVFILKLIEMAATVNKMSIAEMDNRFDNIEKMMTEITKSKLVIADKEYNLAEWITTSDYAKNNHLAIARVHNWISRGVIPKDCFIVVPELNHLKLIKNQSYETRATK